MLHTKSKDIVFISSSRGVNSASLQAAAEAANGGDIFRAFFHCNGHNFLFFKKVGNSQGFQVRN